MVARSGCVYRKFQIYLVPNPSEMLVCVQAKHKMLMVSETTKLQQRCTVPKNIMVNKEGCKIKGGGQQIAVMVG